MKLDYCYHTHTKRCGHAYGEDEEYVISAIENGFKIIGFTDHVMLPNRIQQGIRGTFDQIDDYLNSVKYLKEKYKDKITILVGFECEYYDQYIEYYKSLLESKKVDYLIQGQHCYIGEDNEFHWYLHRPCFEKDVLHYAEDLVKGMYTGLFSYVAHPDLFVTPFEYWDDFLEKVSRYICENAEKTHTPLEINLGGLTHRGNNLHYACEHFWKIVSEYNIDVFIGVDAHDPIRFKDSNFDFAYYLVEKYNLHLLNKIK